MSSCPKASTARLHDRLRHAVLRQVAAEDRRLAAMLRRGLAATSSSRSVDEHPRAVLGEQRSGGAADPARRAGDDRDLPVEHSHAASSVFEAVRLTVRGRRARPACRRRREGPPGSRASSRSLRGATAPRRRRAHSRTGSSARGYAPGSGTRVDGTACASPSARSASGVTRGTSTGSATTVSCAAARSPATRPWTGARPAAPSSRTANGSRPSSSPALPTTSTSSQASTSSRCPRSASVSPLNCASAFGDPNRSDAPPTSSTPVRPETPAVTAGRGGDACRRSRRRRERSRKA